VLAEKCGSKLGPLAHVLNTQEKDAVAREVASFRESGDVQGVAFSPDSKVLATTVFFRREVRLWDWKSDHMIRELREPTSPGGGAVVNAVDSVSFSASGREVASCHVGYNEIATGFVNSTVWNADTGAYVQGLVQNSSCTGVAFLPRTSRLLETLFDGKSTERAILYDTENWHPIWSWALSKAWPQATAISPDGRFAAIGTSDSEPIVGATPFGPSNHLVSRLHIIDLDSGRETRSLDTFAGDNHIDQVAWSADSRQIAVGELIESEQLKGAGIAILNVGTGEIIAKETSDRGAAHVHVLRYTRDGRYLIESGVRDTVEIWDSGHEKLLQEICSQPSSGAVSSDGRYLALGGGAPLLPGGKVFVYELK